MSNQVSQEKCGTTPGSHLKSKDPFYKTELFKKHILPALLIRLAFSLANWKWDFMTDIDYRIYTEGGEKVVMGDSPFDRFTYRYTPLLAWVSIPNIWFEPFGKFMLQACDIMVIWYFGLIMEIMESKRKSFKVGEVYKGLAFWTYNLYMVMINGRGSVESISLVLLSGMIYNLMKFRETEIMVKRTEAASFLKSLTEFECDRHLLKAALFYSGLVHFRLYPILYGFSVVLYI